MFERSRIFEMLPVPGFSSPWERRCSRSRETWELVEAYDWAEWAFWVVLAGMLAFSAAVVVSCTRRFEDY
jgi:hypothetical protein